MRLKFSWLLATVSICCAAAAGAQVAAAPSAYITGTGFTAPTVDGISNVSSPNLGDIAYDATAGLFYGYGNSSTWVSLSGGANTALSNLAATTAVDQNLLPGTTNTFNLGSDSESWNNITTNQVNATNTTGVAQAASALTVEGGNASGTNGAGGNLFLYGGAGGPGGSGTTGNVTIEAPSAQSSGNSGTVSLIVGGSQSQMGDIKLKLTLGYSGTLGKIRFQDASVGTVGYVWTSTDTTGGGTWQLAPYSAGTPGDWAGSAPTTVKAAIDRLAALAYTLNGSVAIP